MIEVEKLKAARKRIADPAHWTKGAFAKAPVARALYMIMVHVPPGDPAATCWCVRGAVMAERPTIDTMEVLVDALKEVTKAGPRINLDLAAVARFNDAPVRRHPEVLNLLDVAIRIAEEKEDQ